MPLSTSSSERTRTASAWIAIWGGALIIAALALAGLELHWRHAGYKPRVLDSMQLWSMQRERVYGKTPRPLVLLGASRTEYGIDLKTLRETLPKYRPVLLAINGAYPLAALHDLADDTNFSGVVLCDMDSRAFFREMRDMQQPYVDYYRRRWTPSWHLHRALLTLWQHSAVLANPDFGVLASLRRLLGDAVPFRNFPYRRANRSGDLDFQKMDSAAMKRHFAENAENNIAHMTQRDPVAWLADIEPVFDWVRAIQARGGEVIFYETPTSGPLAEVTEKFLPRASYWEQLAKVSPAPMLSAHDVPALAATPLPDGSHMDFRSKAAYTRDLVDALVARGLLQR
jgi:hypothetical protein